MNKCLNKIASSTEEEKAIYLTWLRHLVVDIHQPVHCVALFSDKYRSGDRGGNAIRIRISSSPTNLHSFSDGLLSRGVSAGDIGKDVIRIQAVMGEKELSSKPDPDLKANTTPESWAKEGPAWLGTWSTSMASSLRAMMMAKACCRRRPATRHIAVSSRGSKLERQESGWQIRSLACSKQGRVNKQGTNNSPFIVRLNLLPQERSQPTLQFRGALS